MVGKVKVVDDLDPLQLMNEDIIFVDQVFDQEDICSAQIAVAEIRLRRLLSEEMVRAFRGSQLTARAVAKRLNCDPALISRRLKGDENLTLRTIAAMFLAVGHEVVVQSVPFQVADRNAAWLCDSSVSVRARQVSGIRGNSSEKSSKLNIGFPRRASNAPNPPQSVLARLTA